MDSLYFLDTPKIIDTVIISVLDTLPVKVVENTNTIIYLLKLLAPFSGLIGGVLGATVGSYFGYKFALKKESEVENQRLNDIKDHLFHSINLLQIACKKQSENLKDYADAIATEVN